MEKSAVRWEGIIKWGEDQTHLTSRLGVQERVIGANGKPIEPWPAIAIKKKEANERLKWHPSFDNTFCVIKLRDVNIKEP